MTSLVRISFTKQTMQEFLENKLMTEITLQGRHQGHIEYIIVSRERVKKLAEIIISVFP